jgi:hypothetical protein
MPVALRKIALPTFERLGEQPQIPTHVYDARAIAAQKMACVDWLVVYSDREHFGNIVFLTGFEPRFEEAFLLLGPQNERVLITGNESESYAAIARLPGLSVLCSQTLSLMGQDRTKYPRLIERFRDAGIKQGQAIGLVGWKYLEPEEDTDYLGAYFVPVAYVQMIKRLIGTDGALKDSTRVLMHPETGLRAAIDADQIAAFEWAATRCSLALWHIISGVRDGDSEFNAVQGMEYSGDPLNVHTMFASAPAGNPVIGLRSPTGRILRKGDGVTAAIGLWGALSARAGLFDDSGSDFLKLAVAYFEALITWYEKADIGITGADLHAGFDPSKC